MTTPAESAIKYAALGWLVIPVLGKRPVGLEWQKRATCNPVEVAASFDCQHDGVGAQLGKRSNLIDFDCDSDEAQSTLEKLFEGVDIETAFYQSARGKHYLFQWTDRLPQGKIKIVIDGLEIRLGNGDAGCQSVFPPSGDRTWLNDPFTTPIAAIPDVVIERISERYEKTHRPKEIKKTFSESLHSHRADSESLNVPRWLAKNGREIIGRTDSSDGVTRFHIACPGIALHTTDNNFRDCCITQDMLGKLGGSCFHSSCGMRDWPTLRDAIGPLTYADYHAPSIQIEAIADPFESSEVAEDDAPEERGEQIELNFPAELLRPAGFMGEFIDHILSTAKYPQPEHTLAAALAMMSLLTGRRVCDAGGTRGNLMIVALGPTRSGKEHPRAIIKTALELSGAVGLFEEKIASEAALYGFLQKSHAGIFMNDEFGDWLALARSKSGPNTQPSRILTAMTMLYSSSNGRFKAPRYAENSKQVELNQPHLVFLGTSTGEVFWKHVTPEYLSGGLFGRVMLFENRGYVDPMPMYGRNKPIPESILSQIKGWLKFCSTAGDLAWETPDPFIVPHDQSALERFEAHELEISKKRKSEGSIKAALWSGTAEITAKLALLYSCSRSRNPLQISLEDVNHAIRLANWLTRRKIILCDDHVAENSTEDLAKRVLRLIKASGERGIGQFELSRKTQWLKARDRTELLMGLVGSQLIESTEVSTKTKSKTVWIAT